MKKGWEWKTIGEVATYRPPKSEAKSRLRDGDPVTFLPMEDLGVCIKYPTPRQTRRLADVQGSYTYFTNGDVLLAKITPCFQNGKLGIASGLTNGVGFGSSEFIVLRPGTTVTPEWLYYGLSQEHFQVEGVKRMSGAVGQQRVPREFVEAFRMPIPPLPEQRRIVGILDEAFAGLATAEANAARNLQNAREIFDSHLHAVFSQRGPCAVLSEFADEVTDGDHAPPPKASSGVPFITISNINKRTLTIDFSNTFAVPEAYFRDLKSNRKPRVGDVLYTVTGTLGIPILVRQQRDFCFQRHIGLIRPNATTDSSWLAYALRSPQVYRQATVRSTGAAQKTVSLGVLRSLQLPRFKLTEQKKMAAELDALGAETERLAALSERKIAALGELKKSLLHQAFAGGL